MIHLKYRFVTSLPVFAMVLAERAFAQRVTPKGDAGIGGVATNLMEPVGLAANFIFVSCFVLGSSFLFASIIKYVEHRRSPLFTPISTVVFLFLAGLFLLALPFAYMLMNDVSPYSVLG